MPASWIPRTPEPVLMDDPEEVAAYDEADFTEVNRGLASRCLQYCGEAGRAIDLGCGPASISLELCQLSPRWKVLAVDAGRRMLSRGRKLVRAAGLSGQIAFLLADACRVPRPGGAFDLVVSNSLLHHVSDPIGLWVEARRLVRPGGAIVVQDLCRPSSPREADRLVREHAGGESALLRDLFHRSLLAAYRPEELRAQLSFAGLEGLEVKKVSDRHLLVLGRRVL